MVKQSERSVLQVVFNGQSTIDFVHVVGTEPAEDLLIGTVLLETSSYDKCGLRGVS